MIQQYNPFKKDAFDILLPDLVGIQLESFSTFLKKGLIEQLRDFSVITDPTNNLELRLLVEQYKLKRPRYNEKKCIRRACTYASQLYIPAQLINKKTGKVQEQDVFLGEMPIMTSRGNFIINGSARVIVNQIVRSPGIYYKREIDPKEGIKTYSASIICNRGAWLRLETDKNGFVWARIGKVRKVSGFILLRAMGLTKSKILNSLRHPEFFQKTIEEGDPYSENDALIDLHSQLYPERPSTLFAARELLKSKFFDPKYYDLGKVGRYKINKKLQLSIPEDIRVLTPQDILTAIDYLINLEFNIGTLDDIDHLKNRRVRSVGELIENQVRVGLSRLERMTYKRMAESHPDALTPASLINPKPLVGVLREFFGSSQLSQFMDQTNPLSEMTHKRRISCLGPGGLSKERAGLAVRDIHPSHYGRICPIETPEGPNAGLIGSLATHARVNPYGFLESPFYPTKNRKVFKKTLPIYLSPDQEDELRVSPGDLLLSSSGKLEGKTVPIRYKQDFSTSRSDQVDYVGISPIQAISIATSLIPFLEHDDANRALMGSNMQRQAVPVIRPERPVVGTGLEAQAALDSGTVIVARHDGIVSLVDSNKIILRSSCGSNQTKVDSVGLNFDYQIDRYHLQKYNRSNQDTCINQRPVVHQGEFIKKGDILADGAATVGGQLTLGKNVLVAYMPWEGYNFEDAILISQRLVYDDIYTSIHIEKYEIEARKTKLGPEKITREVPNLGDYVLRNLDENGIVIPGAWVEAGDILVGKVTPKEDLDQHPEGKLLRAIFSEKARDVRDTSLRVPNGVRGRVVDVRRLKGSELPSGVNMVVHIFISQKRKIQVGDKMAGRHGNKGIISRILPRQDMPYLQDGTPVDMVLNPLGVPSRMNVGQVYECLLGLAGHFLGEEYKLIPFDEMYGKEASRGFVYSKLYEARKKTGYPWLFDIANPGKSQLFDGRTGEPFDQPVTVGRAYMLKLVHLVDDKIHARSTGPYSLVTQQPLGGKAKHGGQRLGEMEVWALEGFGAAYTLQELLTVKSDDMKGRNEAQHAIIKGRPIPKPGTPESFKVLIRELQSLCLDIGIYKIDKTKKGQEIDLMMSM
uniref:DNA-directed RNA polymerase subunit beta n=1 Tax=Chlorokybus atmophyticus TaxID=3144 RepID=RPOB_CHLAT|nr:RNA polymerase beta subunit [Chlorokybus atmophyticus]Q19V98.2 RecName: Full=DNA-directed RNA polymerase subunit beta; AltName: Full=PEP; AltName: Full=Plastid-encoded RNA polymerase subunit beta; Short=RNA polymerase subunit beta [Chlorokybus atmophyticus]ABD62240.2 beta subunit of RNA polymerase [Chlorokybus atmophyticus]